MLSKCIAIVALFLGLAGQQTGVLRVRVAIADAGRLMPIPRLLLLVSDNPSTAEPRRVRTNADGSIELNVKPGTYTVESDQPLAFGNGTYSWTQMVTVVAGQATMLELSAANAESQNGPGEAQQSGAVILGKWQRSVVEIWTPLRHGAGFVFDQHGAIATSFQAIGSEKKVEVEFATTGAHFKVSANVVIADPTSGAAIVKVDPSLIADAAPIDSGCHAPGAATLHKGAELTAIAATMFGPRSLAAGDVTSVAPQAILTNMGLSSESSGSPVFAADGTLIGIGVLEAADSRGWNAASVVPVDKLCEVRTRAAKAFSTTATSRVHLPVEPASTTSIVTRLGAKNHTGPVPQPVSLSSEDFDLAILTPAYYRTGALPSTPKWDCFNWADYVRYAPQVLMVRITPKFDEAGWKKLARGAAAVQGLQLPPLNSYRSDFDHMDAFCVDQEVAPIHRFLVDRTIETDTVLRPYGFGIPGTKPAESLSTMREGLYVIDPAAFGPQCSKIRLNIYSAKNPQKANTATIDSKLVEQVINSLQ